MASQSATATMKAITFNKYSADASVLQVSHDHPKPTIGAEDVSSGYDLVVKNMATAINPIDYKVRAGALVGGPDAAPPAQPMVVGWDAAGIVEQVSEKASAELGFKKGDHVWYAGDITKSGSYAEYTLIDGRQVAKMPESLSFDKAAAMPLTFQTAYEALFEQMKVQTEASDKKTLFVLNGAGGLGAATIQLGKAAGLTVIATASRPETIEFVKKMGADYVINHRAESLAGELKKLSLFAGVENPKVDFIVNAHDNERFGELVNDLLDVDGKIALTWSTTNEDWAKIDMTQLWFQRKSVIFTLMFSRAMHGKDVHKVGKALSQISQWADEGKVFSHMVVEGGDLFGSSQDELNIVRAHKLQASGKALGKTVLRVAA